MKIPQSLLGLIYLFSTTLFAQDSVRLTLSQALDESLKNNNEVALANLDMQIATTKFNQTHAIFLPQINLSYTAFTTDNPLNAFGFKLQQQAITANDFNPELLNNPASTQNYLTKAEWNQPILNMDMLAQRKAANLQVDVYAYKAKRTKEYVAFEVEKAYTQLQVALHAVTVLNDAVQTVKAIHQSTLHYYEKGLIQKSDLLQVQVHLANTETRLAEAKSNVKNASDYLSLMMGLKPGMIYQTETLEKTTASLSANQQVPENRSDFMALQSAIHAQKQLVNSGRYSYLPKLNAFANYFLNDHSVFGFQAQSYLAGAQLSWNLFSGLSTRSKVAEYKTELTKAERQLRYQKEQAQLELHKTFRQLEDASFNIRQAEIAVEQSSEALRIIKDRYDHGLVSTNDLLQAQTVFSQQKLLHMQAIMQYLTTNAYLKFLTTTSGK